MMYKLSPMLLLLVASLAENHGNSYIDTNEPKIDSRSIFSPLHHNQNDVIKYLQQRREREALRNETLNTKSSTSGPDKIQQQRQNNETELDVIIKYLQQIATTTPSSVPTSDELDAVIRRLQRANGSDVTPAPVRTTTSLNNLSQEEVESCTLESGEPGECVHFYQCQSDGSANTDGGGSIDLRSGFTPCSSYLDVCCRLPDRVTPSPPTKPREGCGWRNSGGVGFRVTGAAGGEANFGEFPWMVAVLKQLGDFDSLFVYAGGGSLIHPSIVLTAAHTLANSTALRVRAGEWDTQTKDEQYPYQDRDVSEVVVHKDYNKRNLFFDIALLFLSSAVEPAPHIGVACLPRAAAADGARCFASGWGKDKFGKEGQYQAILKRVEVPVVGRARCEEALRRTRLGRRFRLHASFLCAGALGQDTCTGDGGSPLVCPTEWEDRYVQHGIVAWGIGCGGEAPGVYVDVAALRDWLDGEVARRGHRPAVYSLD